jgi:aryl-phospho-beta-D-glucosidase BglC (GH1 family)
MGLGWNLGNTMETPGGAPYWSGSVPSQAIIDAVKAAGFRSVRIPCAWYTHTTGSDSMTINTAWLADVKAVVDYCVKDSLFVVLNSHWDKGWLEEHIDAADSAKVKKRQGAYWRQIADYFKSYDRHLLLASANEPAVQDAYGTAFGSDRVKVLNAYHQTFIDTVRATGGNNASRTLIIQGPHADIELTKSAWTTLPTDKVSGRLMAEAHFYPYQYTLMTSDESWGKQFYYWGSGNHSTTDTDHNPTWGEESFVDSEFTILKRMFVDKGMPVIIGEFGAGLRKNLTGTALALHKKGRLAFYKYVAKSGNSHGLIHPFAWDTNDTGSMNMTIINRGKPDVYDQDLMNALLGGWGTTTSVADGMSVDEPSHLLSVVSSSGSIGVSYLAPSAGSAVVTLRDLRGRTLCSRVFQAQAGRNTLDLAVANGGVLLVQVQQGDLRLSGMAEAFGKN